MRKRTASQPRKDRNTVPPMQSGLIEQGGNAQQSAGTGSALANRFHRTRNGSLNGERSTPA